MSVYKGDNLVAGGSVDTYFVRKPAWSQAETIAALPFTAPKDGILLLNVGGTTANGTRTFFINGVQVGIFSSTATGSNPTRVLTISTIPINAGDVLTSDAGVWSAYKFVPFEDSIVTEPEVVTPEYIRNQNILSDVEDIGTIGNSEANAYVCPYDGVIWLANSVNSSNAFSIYINGEIVSYQAGTVPSGAILTTPHITVKKGDKVWIGSNLGTHYFNKARYYKLRDYRGR